MAKKEVIGLVEKVTIIGSKGSIRKNALFDTGATRSSVDIKVAAKVGLGPIISSVRVKSKSSKFPYVRRPIARGEVIVKGKRLRVDFGLEDREKMPYRVLIGRDVIHSNFIIDVDKTHHSNKILDLREL